MSKGHHRLNWFWIISMMNVITFTGCVPRILKPICILAEGVPFEADSEDKDVMMYRNPNLKATSYSKFLIDPVQICSNSSGEHEMRPGEEAMFADSFRQELIKALKSGYQIVDEAGPGVLKIRTAIVDIQPAHLELDEEKFIVLRLDSLLAHVAMELDCLDSESGERVIALVHTLYGERYFEKEKITRLINVREAFSAWTKSLRARFDQAKIRPKQGFGGSDIQDHKELKLEEGE